MERVCRSADFKSAAFVCSANPPLFMVVLSVPLPLTAHCLLVLLVQRVGVVSLNRHGARPSRKARRFRVEKGNYLAIAIMCYKT